MSATQSQDDVKIVARALGMSAIPLPESVASEALAAIYRLEDQLEARTNALQVIYWAGCNGFVEETIIGVLSPEERMAWAKTTSNLDDLDQSPLKRRKT